MTGSFKYITVKKKANTSMKIMMKYKYNIMKSNGKMKSYDKYELILFDYKCSNYRVEHRHYANI